MISRQLFARLVIVRMLSNAAAELAGTIILTSRCAARRFRYIRLPPAIRAEAPHRTEIMFESWLQAVYHIAISARHTGAFTIA